MRYRLINTNPKHHACVLLGTENGTEPASFDWGPPVTEIVIEVTERQAQALESLVDRTQDCGIQIVRA